MAGGLCVVSPDDGEPTGSPRPSEACFAREGAQMKLEQTYLEHILLSLRTGDPDDSLLATFMNSWYAHHRGGAFLDGSGRPKWLSRTSSKRDLAPHLHAVSAVAREALRRGSLKELVIDHTIPSAELIRGLRRRQRLCPFHGAEDLRRYLRTRYTLALLTKGEHDKSLTRCKSKMVGAWCDDRFGLDQSLRYSRYGPDGGNFSFIVQMSHGEDERPN